MAKHIAIESTAEAYLEMLAARGVEYLFATAGTDFAPLIEAYAKRGAQGQAVPRPITVPHEVPAVAMAHGYAMVTRRAQAVMVHVIVGAAHALGGVINAARSQVPMPCSAGRTPIPEGRRRARQPRPADPLGARGVRPGGHGARVRQVGLRAAHVRAARDRGRSRALDGRGRAAGARVPDAPARGAGRAARDVRVRRADA